jgi:NADH-quinone oxidoreductase subunit L
MENFPQLVPIVVFAPLIGMLINLFLGKRLGERGVGIVAVGAAMTALVTALLLWIGLANTGFEAAVVEIPFLPTWLDIPAAAVDVGWQFRVDTLSVTMMLVVSGVGSLIHFYATGYMHGDAMYPRFFVYLNMFLVFMMLLVTGNNFLVMFVGWEGVGLCSYLLISFWWDKSHRPVDPEAARQFPTEGWKNSIAGRKAFIVNRIGDFGLLIGIFLVFWTFGTLDFYKPGEVPMAVAHGDDHAVAAEHGEEVTDEHAAPADSHGEEAAHGEGESAQLEGAPRSATMGVFNQAEKMLEEGGDVDFGPFSLPIETVITLITLFFLLGVTGKSAQIPLFVWLPDAMAGPTPVSALIHAATMVTAGVYLIVRSNVLFHASPLSSAVVTLVGTFTALAGGFIALGQWDVKKVLAYSTVSQLGFMVAAAGLGAYAAAMFHLVTHAFFKALLFLGSGSLIHAMEHGHHHVHEHGHDHGEEGHHEEDLPFDPQDMRNMGGLKNTMPMTYRMYLIGTLALAGIFPFAGFWSKDEILADALNVGFLDGRLEGYIAFIVLFIAALFTAFYMGRQLFMVFYGEPRTEAAKYTNETAYGMKVMTNVLIALGIGSTLIGFINVPSGFWIIDWLLPEHSFTSWLEHTVVYAHAGSAQMLLAILAVGAGLTMIFLARSIYLKKPVVNGTKDPLEVNAQTAGMFTLANARLYWDETYDRFLVQPFNRAARWFAEKLDWAFWHDFFHETILRDGYNGITRVLTTPVDLGLIDGTVNGLGRLVRWGSGNVRRLQTGYVRLYALSVLFGALLVVVLLIAPLLRQMFGL